MVDARAAGIHWRTGPAPDGRDGAADPIFEVLDSSSPTILNEPEAQWHWAAVAGKRSGLTVWRASPERRPADDGWDPHVFSRAVFKSLDAHHDRTGVYPTDVLLLNELNLDYERGEDHHDGGAFDTNPANWPDLNAKIADFLNGLLDNCKERATRRENFNPRWWFQGWAPGHGHRDFFDVWGPVAKRYDGICLHGYDGVDTITDEILWYARKFPDHPLLLGEWNTANMDPSVRQDEDARIRARLGSLCSSIERLQCCYFIWRWETDSVNKYGIEGDDGRRQIWDSPLALPADGFVPTLA